jgi:hypothetical protein
MKNAEIGEALPNDDPNFIWTSESLNLIHMNSALYRLSHYTVSKYKAHPPRTSPHSRESILQPHQSMGKSRADTSSNRPWSPSRDKEAASVPQSEENRFDFLGVGRRFVSLFAEVAGEFLRKQITETEGGNGGFWGEHLPAPKLQSLGKEPSPDRTGFSQSGEFNFT